MGNTRTSLVRGHLLVVALAIIFLVSPVSSVAADELVKNGGFETGDLTEWGASNAKVVKSSSKEPAHSGKHSVRIGTVKDQGQVNQTVAIPSKSISRFTAWYRLGKHSILSVYLKRIDGTIIWSKTMSDLSSWVSVTYDLDVSFAGQSVVVEFVGIGYRQTERYCEILCPQPGFCIQVCSEDHADYWPYIDDVSFTYTVVEYETNISVAGLPAELATTIMIDGSQMTALAGGQSENRAFRIGETHEISVEKYVYAADNNTRYYCGSYSATVSSDGLIVFSYTPQFRLSVTSEYGQINGSGWYDAGSVASFSVDRDTAPMTGLSGTLGAKYVFVKWIGDASGSSTMGQIAMEGPRSVSAVWAVDNSAFYLSTGAIASVSVCAVLGTYMLITKKKIFAKLSLKTPVGFPPRTGAVESSSRPEMLSEDPSPEDVLDRLERLERSHAKGTITDEVYQQLKAELETRLAVTRTRKSK